MSMSPIRKIINPCHSNTTYTCRLQASQNLATKFKSKGYSNLHEQSPTSKSPPNPFYPKG